jgi:hypothetical protein
VNRPRGVRRLLVAPLVLAGCGYIGPPQAPSLAIPQRIVDLTVAERGDQILAQFTIPSMSTQGLPLDSIRSVDLRAGVTPNPWNQAVWEASASRIEIPASAPGALSKAIPLNKDWIGKEVTIGVRATGPKGKTSDWSNLRQLTIAPPLAAPADFKAENTPRGVELSWRSSAPHYHIFRATGDAAPELLADSDQTSWLDSAIEYGASYRYYVQGFSGELQQSPVAGPQTITPEDVFAPAIPSGLAAEQGTNAIELSWERNTEPRFQGYNVYRSVDGGPFVKIASRITAPTYSDHDISSGKKYRYQVSAVATNGKESDRSQPVEITAQ